MAGSTFSEAPGKAVLRGPPATKCDDHFTSSVMQIIRQLPVLSIVSLPAQKHFNLVYFILLFTLI